MTADQGLKLLSQTPRGLRSNPLMLKSLCNLCVVTSSCEDLSMQNSPFYLSGKTKTSPSLLMTPSPPETL